MNIRNIPVYCVIIKRQYKVVLYPIKNQFMKVTSIHVHYVHLKHQIIVILINTFNQIIKEEYICPISVVKSVKIYEIYGITMNHFVGVKYDCSDCQLIIEQKGGP